MRNLLDLNKKIALITGATRGIGFEAFKLFTEHNCTVIGTGTSEKSVEKINKYLQSTSKQGEGIIMDAQDRHSIQKLIQHIQAKYQAVDILINNAGITRDNLMLRMKEQQWDDVIATNLSAPFLLCQKIIQLMIRKKIPGKIINVSSVVGVSGNAGQANYAASKGGMIALTKTIAKEFASRGITANCIAPGFIDTEMIQKVDSKIKDFLIEYAIPLKRLGSAEEIAGALLFLASNLSNYMTGTVLDVNGGIRS